MKKNTKPLSLRVPEPSGRPGDTPDFSHLKLDAAGAVARPDALADPHEMREMAFRLVRVLDDSGKAVGPWDPKLDPDTLRRGLKAMVLTRAFDDRMHRAHRQGKTSFYMKCTGEEAIAVAQGMILPAEDMGFPTYRQQGLSAADHVLQPRLWLLHHLGQSRHPGAAGRRLGHGLGLQGR